MTLDPISWVLVVAIVAAEIALPLALAFWAGRRVERRRQERTIAEEAAAWLEERTAADPR